MRRVLSILSLLAVLVAPARAAADLDVVTTTTDLASIAQAVGGSRVGVTALALPTQDPHFVDPRPHLALKLARADLLIAVGLGLEQGWLPTLQENARNGDIQTGASGYFDASRHVDRMGGARGRVERSMGDVHPGGNPHFLFDPRRGIQVAHALAERMGELDPDHASAYAKGAARLERTLRSKMRGWAKRAAPLGGAPVIAYHRSFPYLADWLGFEVVAHVEPRPGIPPNPRHVARLLRIARSKDVKVLLQEGWYPTRTSELIAGRSDAHMVRVPGGPSVDEGEGYVEWIDGIVTRLVRAVER